MTKTKKNIKNRNKKKKGGSLFSFFSNNNSHFESDVLNVLYSAIYENKPPSKEIITRAENKYNQSSQADKDEISQKVKEINVLKSKLSIIKEKYRNFFESN